MDYEKKYNEALERARALWREAIEKEYVIDYLKDYETIFPELRESEDERIRKWLINYFGSIKETVWIHRDITCEQILEWLKKQKQKAQKQTDLPAGFYYIDLNGNRYYSKEFRYGDMKLKVGEQKPNQSEEEREYVKTLKGLVSDFIRDSGGGISDVAYYQRICDWLDERHIEQKPAERSEEDESMRWNIISVIGQSNCVQADDMIDWLKSPRPPFKPSEEQMKALYEAAQDAAIDREGGNALYELYEHLKRL